MEKTLILIKPDGVERGLTGEILARFEKTGLKLAALKLVHADKKFMQGHYGNDPDWIRGMGQKTLKNYKEYAIDPIEELGTDDDFEIGKMIYEWLTDWMSSGPVVAAVFEGNHAVDIAKKIAGNTIPLFAQPGTIRADYSTESADLANRQKRPIQNLVHISGNLEDASREVRHWFPELDS